MSRTGSLRKIEGGGSDRAGRTPLQALVAEARAQQMGGLADRLEKATAAVENARSRSTNSRLREQSMPVEVTSSLVLMPAQRRLRDLVLPAETTTEIREFIDEYAEMALLRANGLEPRHKVLLVGPPGTGKTSLAEVLAAELHLPFFVVRYDGLIASYLGETASRLRALTDFVADIPCVVFFDEFDTVGKERGDSQETGEIKRVVSSLLLQMDVLPSSCVIVCATNHPELLDRAVWRRFELRVDVPLPGAAEIAIWYRRLQKDFRGNLSVSEDTFVKALLGYSFSDIESFTLDVKRKIVVSKGKISPGEALEAGLAKLSKKRSHLGDAENRRPANSSNSPRRRRSKEDQGRPETKVSQGSLI